jgi:glycosyltransferase involved in cell wall biosynthesis
MTSGLPLLFSQTRQRLICNAIPGSRQIPSLYNLADAYVTPYRAEGFNLPACEAQACGTPVIATQGGATDDFLQGNAANHFIAGTLHENTALQADLTRNAHIEPQLDALVALLENLGRKATNTQALDDLINRSWQAPAARLVQLLRTGS